MDMLPWIVFAALVVGMLALDLGVFNRKAHVVGFKEAITWSAVWVGVSLAFAGLVFFWRGSETGMAFLAGYLVEKALSVDNLFVFMVLFAYFKVPRELEHKVLFWGVIGALVTRAVLIAAGLSLMHAFHEVIYVFGVLLVATGLRLAMHRGPGVDPGKNPVLKLIQRVVPMSPTYVGSKLTTRIDGRLVATPMVAVLVAVETTDILFAIDSIPAVMAVSTDPFVVYTSNVFAVLGLRAMYVALAGLMECMRYFDLGLAAVLVFVGVKMLLSDLYPVPIPFSLAVIAGLIGVAILASWMAPDERRNRKRRRRIRIRSTSLVRTADTTYTQGAGLTTDAGLTEAPGAADAEAGGPDEREGAGRYEVGDRGP